MDFGYNHTWPMNDYSTTHGFNVLSTNGRGRKPATLTWLPAGTKFTFWTGLSRGALVKSLGITDPELLDQLVDMGDQAIIDGLIKAGTFKGWDPEGYDETYLDMEEGCPD